jgi:hypothetical protein
MNQFNVKTIDTLLAELSERQRKVIAGRFGLDNKGTAEKETLEAIGRQFGITRERVRQIEAVSLKVVADNVENSQIAQSLLKDAKKELKDAGGVMQKANLISRLASSYEGITENYLGLLLGSSHAFESHPEDESFKSFYYLDKESLKKAEGFISQWVKQLRTKKKAILEGTYHAEFKDFIKGKNLPSEHAENYMGISKLIHVNSFGDMGLTEWSEVNPKTIRDRIHLVLRKKKEPVHFTDIANLINQAKLDDRVALASTVHNELIKDGRFVLVGRGMYGLAEHGYEPGTAQEVIAKILKKHGPLKSNDIVQAVQKERLFKHNTILVNLQNRQLFERQSDGTYKVREA